MPAQTLAEVIALEPLNAQRTDAQVLSWILEPVSSFKDISWLDLSMWVSDYDLRPTLVASASTGTASRATGAQFILDTIASGQPLYTSDARVRGVVSKAIAPGTARDALIAMAATTVPRHEKHELPRPLLGDVIAARV